MTKRVPAAAWRDRLGVSIVPRIRAFAESPEMVAIRTALPLSFIGLAAGIVLFMFREPGGTLLERFYRSFAASFGIMSATLVVLLSGDLARRRAVPSALAIAVAGAAFALALPYRQASSFESLAKALGTSGLFLAIVIGLLTVEVLRAARLRFGAKAGSFIGGTAVVGTASLLLALGVSLTAALDWLIAPLGTLGDSLTALLVITLVETLLWSIGIHGPALLAAVVLPVYLNLQAQNTEALAHNHPLPHIVTVSLFLFVFPGGAGATLPLVLLLLRSRVGRVRKVAFATLVPTLFNANEPLMFGLPLVLNPILALPFVLVPIVLALLTYGAIGLGFVARPAFYIPSSVPQPLGVFLATKDWHAVVLVALNVVVGLGIYAPFVGLYERAERARVREAA